MTPPPQEAPTDAPNSSSSGEVSQGEESYFCMDQSVVDDNATQNAAQGIAQSDVSETQVSVDEAMGCIEVPSVEPTVESVLGEALCEMAPSLGHVHSYYEDPESDGESTEDDDDGSSPSNLANRIRNLVEYYLFFLEAVAQNNYLWQEYLREAIVWRQLRHPNILPCLGLYYLDRSQERICLVSPWMENGNLVQFLRDSPRDSGNHLQLMHDIASGLSHLHGLKIIHGDLKGLNILVTQSHRACIADFGLSHVADSQT
ncbi:hypothetical protein MPER_10225, partial [Moniliophthora perniciosa FA553]